MADFNFYLNRAGVRGPQGPQGEQGFSPDITVERDTLSEYILRVTNEGGYFLTSNLREHKEDRGGTYIRYDRDKGEMYAGDADVASTDTLGVIRIAKDDDFAGRAEDAAVTPAQIQDYLDDNYVDVHNEQNIEGDKRFQGSVYIKQLMTPTISSDAGTIINFDLDTKASTFTSDVSFTKTPTVESLGELALKSQVDAIEPIATEAKNIANAAQIAVQKLDSEVVHNTGSETVAGLKTFSDRTTFKLPISITPDINGYIIDSKWMIGSANTILSHSGTSYIAFGRSGLTVTAPDASAFAGKVLTVNSITAGDNITLEKTDTGVVISSTGGGLSNLPVATADVLGAIKVGDNLSITEDGVLSAEKGVSQDSFNQLVAKVSALQTALEDAIERITALETLIDGGNAGDTYPADPQKIDANPQVDSAINTGEASNSVDITVEDN